MILIQLRASFIKEWQQALAGPAFWITIGLLASSQMALMFFASRFFDANRADLSLYFGWLPWVLAVFIPVLGAGSFARELEEDTISLTQGSRHALRAQTAGKLAAIFCMGLVSFGFALPFWLQLAWLGATDNGAILAGFFGAVLMMFSYAGISLFASSLGRSTSISALLGIFTSVLLNSSVLLPLMGFLPPGLGNWLAGFSVPSQTSSFIAGIVQPYGIWFLLSLGFLFGFASLLVMQRRQAAGCKAFYRKLAMAVFLFAGSGILVSAGTSSIRFDWTAQKQFSPSSSLLQKVANMKEPVTWQFFFSESTAAAYPEYREAGAHIRHLLRVLAAKSNGMLKLGEISVLPDTASQDMARDAGLKPVLAGAASVPIYFGLADQHGPLIEQFSVARKDMLEFHMLQALRGTRQKTRLALVDTTDMRGRNWYVSGRKETALLSVLEQSYDLVEPAAGTTFSNQHENLIIVHPARQSDQQNQLLAARLEDDIPLRMMIFADPWRESASRTNLNGLPDAAARPASLLPEPLGKLGIEMVREMAVLDTSLAAQTLSPDTGDVQNWPLWLRFSPKHVQPATVLALPLSKGVMFASAGALLLDEKSDQVGGWKSKVLLQTSKTANIVPVEVLAEGATELHKFTNANMGQVRILAAYIYHPKKQKHLVVISDTDLLEDAYYGRNDPVFGWQEQLDNAKLLTFLLEVLVNDPSYFLAEKPKHISRSLWRIEKMRSLAQTELQAGHARLEKLQNELAASIDVSADLAKYEMFQAQIQEVQLSIRTTRNQFARKMWLTEMFLIAPNLFGFPLIFVLFGLWRIRRQSARTQKQA